MDLQEASEKLHKEWDERHAQWRAEARERIAAGTPKSLDRLFAENDPQHWYDQIVDAGWAARRFVSNQIVHIHWWHALKNFYSRGRRGWGTQDWWNLDSYLAGWLPDALRHLAEKEHGHPCKIIGPDGETIYLLDYDPDANEEVETGGDGMEVWKATLNRMADGFAAWKLLSEYGWTHDESEAERELERMRDEGLKIFINNYESLWD